LLFLFFYSKTKMLPLQAKKRARVKKKMLPLRLPEGEALEEAEKKEAVKVNKR
jgi:hypothetical protein